MTSMTSEMISKFRDLVNKGKQSSGNAITQEKFQYGGVLPPEQTTVKHLGDDNLDEKIAKIQFKIPELPASYGNVMELTQNVTSKTDFVDKYWADKVSIKMERITDDEVLRLGRILLGSLTSGVSSRIIGSIFLLAYQLKLPGYGTELYLMEPEDELHTVSDLSVNALNNDVIEKVGEVGVPIESGKKKVDAQCYAYYAASMLKMFTRSAENYDKSWTHVNEGYKKFYLIDCPITGITPSLSVLKTIHDNFAMNDLYRQSLYRFLYNANKNEKISSIQKYLYDIHLSNTGMHVVPIAYRICISMNCSPVQLLRVIHTKRFEPQIKALIAAFSLMTNTDAQHKRQMWKYGRIFDSEFLSHLQTKSCPKFVYILACILQRENAKSAMNILQIKQLEEVSSEDQIRLKAGAKILVEAINILTSDDDQNLMSQVMNL